MAAETTIGITLVARDDIRRYAAVSGGQLGQRVRIPDALRLAVHIASQHPEDVAAAATALGLVDIPTTDRESDHS